MNELTRTALQSEYRVAEEQAKHRKRLINALNRAEDSLTRHRILAAIRRAQPIKGLIVNQRA